MCGWNMRHTGDDNISFDALGPCLASFLSLEGEKGLILRKCITALQASCDLQRTFEMVAILLLGIQVGFRSVTHVYALSDPLRLALLPRIRNYISLELTGITMKKPQLLDIVCALILFAMNSSAFAAIIASDDTSIASTGQSYAQTLASSSSAFSDGALTLDVLGNSGQTELDENFGYFIDGTLPVARSPHADSHMNLWVLLIAAAVAGTLSELFHRRSVNR